MAWDKTLPPSKARDQVLTTGKPQDGAGKKTAKAKEGKPAKPALDRSAIFKKKDTDHDGKMTLEEFLKNFPDQEEGKKRFSKFDRNGDGVLTEEEFVKAGKN
jgi:hypothetical protein